jgi:hypothetical protein
MRPCEMHARRNVLREHVVACCDVNNKWAFCCSPSNQHLHSTVMLTACRSWDSAPMHTQRPSTSARPPSSSSSAAAASASSAAAASRARCSGEPGPLT